MIYTSYFANHRKFQHLTKVSISRFPPKWFSADIKAFELAPSAELLKDYKDGNVSDSEYEIRYFNETLSKLNPLEIYQRYDGSVFLCFEKSSDFCHRQIVANWLKESGFQVEEI